MPQEMTPPLLRISRCLNQVVLRKRKLEGKEHQSLTWTLSLSEKICHKTTRKSRDRCRQCPVQYFENIGQTIEQSDCLILLIYRPSSCNNYSHYTVKSPSLILLVADNSGYFVMYINRGIFSTFSVV